jgi:methylated-DNA-[protein]-cysteine S-methyltransferase
MTTELELEQNLRQGPPDAKRPLPNLLSGAGAAGLIDIAYAVTDSPVGSLLLAATERGLLRLAYAEDEREDAVLEDLAARVSPRVLAAPARLDEPRRELEQYFDGRRRAFQMPLDWRLVGPFGRRVLEAATAIPYGAVSTYAEVAVAAGSPRGARATGNALGANPLPIVLPCHRVLRSGGGLGGYTGGLDKKRTLLALEAGASPLPGA